MNDIDEQQDRLIRLLSPDFTLPASAAEPNGHAADDLLRRIMATSSPERQPATAAPRRRRFRLALAIPVAAALAVLAVLAAALLPATSPVGPRPAQADALRITAGKQYLDIRIVDPVADPRRYRAELAKHGLDIDLALAPAGPDQVGRVIFQEVSDSTGPTITTVEAPGKCTANGDCSVAIRVPLTYKGHARIVFGRTALPGESVEGDAPVLTPRQHQQLRALVGKTVSDARHLLAQHGQTASYRVGFRSLDTPADQVPGTWYVYEVAPLPDNVVALWVSADGKEPAPNR